MYVNLYIYMCVHVLEDEPGFDPDNDRQFICRSLDRIRTTDMFGVNDNSYVVNMMPFCDGGDLFKITIGTTGGVMMSMAKVNRFVCIMSIHTHI